VVLAIAADLVRTLMAAVLLFAVAGSRWLGLVSWGTVILELVAAYLLLQEDSLKWLH